MPAIPKRTTSKATNIPDEIFSDILKGNYSQYLDTIDFNQFLSDFLLEESTCKENSSPYDPNCILHNTKPIVKIKFLELLVKKDELKNVWNFCRDYISSQNHQISEATTQKLLQLQSDFIVLYTKKFSTVNDTFAENDAKTINSYFSFEEEFFQIPDFMTIEANFFSGENAFTYSKNLLKSIIKMAPNAQDSIVTNQTNAYNYDITNLLNSFVKGAGNLILKLRNNDEPYHDIEASVKDLINEATIKVTPTELSSIRFNFLSQYHQGYSDIENVCQQLFNTTECYPYVPEVNQQFELITQGHSPINSTESSKILEQFLFGSENSILERLKYFSITKNKNNKLSNLLDYFKKSLSIDNEQNQDLSANVVSKLSRLLIHLKGVFSEGNIRPKILNKALSLFLTMLKNPSIANHDFHLWPVLSACADEVKILLKNYNAYSASHNTDINTTLRIFSAILHSINNINSVINQYNQEINTIVKELSEACLNLEICDSFTALNQFSKNLGTMARRLFKTGKLSDAESTLKNVQAILKNATNQVTEDELKGIAWTFLNQYHDKDASQITSDCKKLFNLSDCHEFIASNGTMEMEDDTTPPTTLIPEVITNNTTSTTTTTSAPQVNTTVAPAINQTVGYQEISTFSPISFPETPSTTEIITAITQDLGSKLPSATEIGSTAAHSFGSGLLNLMTQAMSIWLRSKGHGESIISAISLSLAGGILQASYMATFPLMLFTLNQLVAEGNEEKAQAQWDLMTQEMLPAFFTSLTLSTGLQLLNYLSENYLSKQSTLKSLIQSIPTLSSLWSFSRNPILTGIHTGTAYVVSSIGLAGFNRFFSARNNQKSDIEVNRNIVEMENLTTESNNEELEINTKKTEPARTFKYLTEENLESVRKNSRKLKTSLEKFISLLQKSRDSDELSKVKSNNKNVINEYEKSITDKNHVLELLKEPFNMVNILHERLMDKNHDEACRVYTDFAVYNKVIGETGNVFKLMQGFYETTKGNNNLRDALSKLYGFVEGRTENFDSGTLQTLEEMHASLDTLLSPVRGFVSAYNTADAAYQGEKRGEIKANLLNGGNITSTLLRQKKSVEPKTSLFAANNRRFTFSGDSDNSRTSTASDESDKSGNSAYNPIDPQQETPLLNGTTYRV
ncbi:hypothetical protein [Rickettsiella endosymbiont of Miltochrista miniata]|uniref:hypothetical protein n=1 Tax=Rickettsiella endosymbiont of Miltochrista miniata TaxID=3066239 RepID=UPI00313E2BBF